MREIKFRIWRWEKMDDNPYFPYLDSISLNLGFRMWQEELGDNAIIMMYTGLKDNKIKEIYEGDILLCEDEYPQTELDPPEPHNGLGLVAFKEGTFGVIFEDDTTHYSKGFMSFEMINNEWGAPMEIVGNKYKNPNFLKEKTR